LRAAGFRSIRIASDAGCGLICVVGQINALRVPLGTSRYRLCGVPTSPRNERGEAKTGLREAIG
jgi:hypothetical protein